jgi:prepilin-type N-terminal cleavage/methylation domain-containing protein
MKINTSRKAGFTLVEIMIVVAIIGLLAAIAIPNFVKARNTSQSNACINNMRQIDSAVQQWALETGQDDTAVADAVVVGPYIKGLAVPTCPAGNAVYVFAADITVNPIVTCPNAAAPLHTLP